MQETRKVIDREQTLVQENGAVVTRKSQSISHDAGTKTTAVNAVWYLYGFVAILLSLRFVLKLAGANPENGFARFVFGLSGVFSAPFDTLFGKPSLIASTSNSYFETGALIALAIYALVAWGVVKLMALNESR